MGEQSVKTRKRSIGKLRSRVFRLARRLNPILLVFIAVVLVLMASQVERFVNKGTVLGYQVRRVPKTSSIASKDLSKRMTSSSKVCKQISADFVSKQLKQEVTESTFLPDKIQLENFSSCMFRTKEKPFRSVSVTVRERSNEDEAKKTLVTAAKQSVEVKIEGVDEAYFTEKANRLTARRGSKVATIVVMSSANDKVPSQDAAVAMAKQLFLN